MKDGTAGMIVGYSILFPLLVIFGLLMLVIDPAHLGTASVVHKWTDETLGFAWGPYDDGEVPTIRVTYIPEAGSRDKLRGEVDHVNVNDFQVAIFVNSDGWWNMPSGEAPLTTIRFDGYWQADINFEVLDYQTMEIAVYLVPDDYEITLLNGGVLPSDLEEVAVASVRVSK